MRLCSRCAGWGTSDVFGGSGRLTCVVPMRLPRSAQPTTSSANSAAITWRAGNPDAPPGERLRLETRGGKHALIALGDGDGEILRPAPPEIHIDGAAALAHRLDLALDQRKPAAALEDPRGVFGLVDDIIRFAPQAKLGGACRQLFAEQRPRAC